MLTRLTEAQLACLLLLQYVKQLHKGDVSYTTVKLLHIPFIYIATAQTHIYWQTHMVLWQTTFCKVLVTDVTFKLMASGHTQLQHIPFSPSEAGYPGRPGSPASPGGPGKPRKPLRTTTVTSPGLPGRPLSPGSPDKAQWHSWQLRQWTQFTYSLHGHYAILLTYLHMAITKVFNKCSVHRKSNCNSAEMQSWL